MEGLFSRRTEIYEQIYFRFENFEYFSKNIPNITKVLPDVEGPLTETHFVYPQSLKNIAKVKAFRNFLFSKVSEWKF